MFCDRMAKHCWIVVICVMHVYAVHGDEDENRWNTLSIPRIDAGNGKEDQSIMTAALSDMYCAYCQSINDPSCIRKWCNKAFRLALAAEAQRPFAVTETILLTASLSTTGPMSRRTFRTRMMIETESDIVCKFSSLIQVMNFKCFKNMKIQS